MNSLGVNWFIEGYIDFEHKKVRPAELFAGN
jgi:hypothetical protein